MPNYRHELIVVICNQGFVDDIMETAKLSGARGGTVLHGRGTASEETIKFFGLKVHPEKEIILIVTSVDKKSKIMKSITDKHGFNSEARSICFSMPVSEVVGFNFQ